MTILTVHSNNAISGQTTFQRSLLKAILDTDYQYTRIDSGLVVLASADPSQPQYNLAGRLLDIGPGGELQGIVERIEIFRNAAAVNPSVAHLLEGEQLLADLDAAARAGSGPVAAQNYGTFYDRLGSFGSDHEIHGSNGDDMLETLLNTSLVRGFKGSDTFLFYGGVTYDGGKGVDYLDIGASGRNVGVDLSQNLASDGNISTLISIEGVIGSDGDDRLTGNGKKNMLSGKDGDDDIKGGGGKDRLFGNNGNDFLEGGDGNDKIFAGGGNDVATGGRGDDLIDGGRGDDRLIGGDGDDEILGKDGDDTIFGEKGNDTLRGDNGRDLLDGGSGRDRLFGGGDKDTLEGGERGDILNGGNGKDILRGDEGNDELFGGKGGDTLNGGTGDDDLWGLGGNDTFLFFAGFGNDTVHDYKSGFDEIRIDADRADVSVEQLGRHSVVRVTEGADVHVIEVLNASLTMADLNLF